MKTESTNLVTHTPSEMVLEIGQISDWMNEFYKAKKVEGISETTQRIYKHQMEYFFNFCQSQVITQVQQITANSIRNYLLWLQEQGHNPGGQHMAYRVLKTFLCWYDREVEPENWHNPIHKVKAPKITEEPLNPVEIIDVQAMVKTCDNSYLGHRNRAMLLFLLDSGVRAREMLSINLEDVNLITGEVIIKNGKGRKPRMVFIGRKTVKTVRAYLKIRDDKLSALWVTNDRKNRLLYGGLRVVLMNCAEKAGLKPPRAHDFRRAFAINMLRNGVDLITLSRLMGHTSLKVLQRYLKQVTDDLKIAHNKASPVDNSDL